LDEARALRDARNWIAANWRIIRLIAAVPGWGQAKAENLETQRARRKSAEQRRGTYSRLINEATYPAPNPLSMFTTLTFDAHEFIMPSNAARPLKDAP
jgi:hypothetical protein